MIVETEREEEGRWIAEVRELPGVMTYGKTRDEAISRAKALALRVMADRLEHGEEIPELDRGGQISRSPFTTRTKSVRGCSRVSRGERD